MCIHLHPILRFLNSISFVCFHGVPPKVTVFAYMKANLQAIEDIENYSFKT